MEISAVDSVWVLVSSALVMLMTVGLALFYGGMVDKRNVLATFAKSLFLLGIVSLHWVVLGYSLAFGGSVGGVIGDFTHAFFSGVGLEAKGTIPHLLFAMYQLMFAVITPALISGAVVERIKFSAYCLFTLAWATLVYAPIAHWTWNSDGWLFKLGALDFAGGTVVHLSSGISALVAALVLGKRNQVSEPHNITMTLLGGGLLWFGWFGFNAGSALGANALATLAFANTHLAAGAGLVTWALVERLKYGKITMVGCITGAVAGLVGVTPAAGFVSVGSAIAIGALTAVACHVGVWVKGKLGYDDSLDAFGIHGVGGAAGALLTGVFASKLMNSAGNDGLLLGGASVFGVQALSVAVVAVYAGVVSWLILKALDKIVGLRVDDESEAMGLDAALHKESGYRL